MDDRITSLTLSTLPDDMQASTISSNSLHYLTRHALNKHAMCVCPQASVLSFLVSHDLARFSSVTSLCRNAATRDPLWQHWLETHFSRQVKPWARWGPTPAQQYSALAAMRYLWAISLCHMHLPVRRQ
jgi:hypothetical protein